MNYLARSAALVAFVVGVSARTAWAADPLPLVIQNARDGLAATVETRGDGTAEWTQTVRIVVATGTPEVVTKDLKVQLGPLATAAGDKEDAVTPREVLASSPEKLLPGEHIELTLRSKFHNKGDYKGELLLYVGTLHQTLAVTITVADPVLVEPPLVEHGKPAISLTESFTGKAASTASIHLRNSGPHELILREPRLVSSRRVDKVEQPTRDFQVANITMESVGTKILPGDVRPIVVEVKGIGEPGIYQFEVLVPVDGYQPKTFTVTVYRRAHWFWPGFYIAIGAIVAFAVRRFVQGGHARLKVRRNLAALRPQIAAVRAEAHEPAHVGAAMVLAADLDRMDRDVRWNADGDKLLAASERMSHRIRLLDEIVAASNVVARLDRDLQAEPREVLDEVLAAVKVDPDKLEDLTAARGKVANLMVDETWRNQLRTGVSELTIAVTALAQSSTDLATALSTKVQPELDAARDAVSANQLLKGRDALERARAAFLAIAVDELGKRPPPFGATPDKWQPVKDKITAHLALASAGKEWKSNLEAFQKAQREYVRIALAGLAAYARRRLTDTKEPPNAPANLGKLADQLEALDGASDDSIDDAGRTLKQLEVDVRTAAKFGDADRVGSIAAATRTVFVALGGEAEMREGLVTKEPPLVQALDAAIRWTDWLVTAAVLAIAILSGVKTLWTDDLSWGANTAWLTAFLWGAGVGSVGEVFTGVIGLREKLGGTPT